MRIRSPSVLMFVSVVWVMTIWLFIIVIDQKNVYTDVRGLESIDPLPRERYFRNEKEKICSCPCDTHKNSTMTPSEKEKMSGDKPVNVINNAQNSTKHKHDVEFKLNPRDWSGVKRNIKPIEGGVPAKLIQPEESESVWLASSNDTESDRVLAQMNLHRTASNRTKTIVVVGNFGAVYNGNQQFVKDNCPVKACNLVQSRNRMPSADMILFKGNGNSVSNYMHGNRRPDQIVVWYELESELNSGHPPPFINWTASFRRDSTINTPYERFTPYQEFQHKLPPPSKNYAAGKTKMAAWFVSNCNPPNKRDAYVAELRKYISVDIYGACGSLKCSKRTNNCNSMLSNDYKFYLAFENSNCVDYITEKFYWNGLSNDVLPVVLGAHPEDYKKVAPPLSYIHVDDFESPRHLADYLKILDKHDNLYNEYFRWKGTGTFINTKFWCRLCAMAHEADLSKTRMYYKNTSKWWKGDGVCISSNGTFKWASWRNVTRKYSYMDNDTLIIES